MSRYDKLASIINGKDEVLKRVSYLNILLVYMGLRPGAITDELTLEKVIEFIDYLKDFPELQSDRDKGKELIVYELLNPIPIINVAVSYKDYNSFPLSEEGFGRFLGYHCAEHFEFNSFRGDRTFIHVIDNTNNLNVYTQFCDITIKKGNKNIISYDEALDKIRDDVNYMNLTMEKFHLPFHFQLLIEHAPSSNTLLSKINDLDYVRDNISYYINDLYDWFCESTQFNDEQFIFQHYPLFKFIYILANNGLFDTGLETGVKTMKQCREFEQTLLTLARELWPLFVLNSGILAPHVNSELLFNVLSPYY